MSLVDEAVKGCLQWEVWMYANQLLRQSKEISWLIREIINLIQLSIKNSSGCINLIPSFGRGLRRFLFWR